MTDKIRGYKIKEAYLIKAKKDSISQKLPKFVCEVGIVKFTPVVSLEELEALLFDAYVLGKQFITKGESFEKFTKWRKDVLKKEVKKDE